MEEGLDVCHICLLRPSVKSETYQASPWSDCGCTSADASNAREAQCSINTQRSPYCQVVRSPLTRVHKVWSMLLQGLQGSVQSLEEADAPASISKAFKRGRTVQCALHSDCCARCLDSCYAAFLHTRQVCLLMAMAQLLKSTVRACPNSNLAVFHLKASKWLTTILNFSSQPFVARS